MTKKLNIAITADPEIPVPPLLYGGIERIIDLLIKELIKNGHEVSLFAHAESLTDAKLYPYKGKTSNNKVDFAKNLVQINQILFKEKFDLVHSFGRLAYLLPQLPTKLPKLMSYQREPTISQVKKAMLLAKKNSLAFSGCSNYISNKIKPFAPAYTVYNGVEKEKYNFSAVVENDAPLVFLGRIEPIKGTHIAIEVAQKTGKKLIIAGNIPDEYRNYFNQKIKPHLNDSITYIGAVNDLEKNKILGSALAFLMPIEWDEPFGIVMAEALMCGTPVIGFNRGAVPEVVIDEVNGFKCDSTEQMCNYVGEIHRVNRTTVRKDAEKRFSAETIASEYLAIYNLFMNKTNG